LLFQTIRESKVALAVVAEPYRILDALNWIGDLDGLAAITWTPALSGPGALLDRGSGNVAVEWPGIAVAGVYVSPTADCQRLETSWTGLANVSGDVFPARHSSSGISTQWGNPRTDA
jgi:hypothetical protein